MAFDKTTLTRNLRLIKTGANGDIAPDGKELLVAARPGWKQAQQRLRGTMSGA
jgi:hypothetical protein